MWFYNVLTFLVGLPNWIAAPVAMFLLTAIPACGFALWQYSRPIALGFAISITLSIVPLIVSAILPASIVVGSTKTILNTTSLFGTAGFGGVSCTQVLRGTKSRKQILGHICAFCLLLAWISFLVVT